MSIAQNGEMPTQECDASYEVTRFNAVRHGILSRFTVLPWEDEEEYRGLLDALAAEHDPRGPTEEHLVEEVAGVIWRKRRLRLGEAAAHHRALKRTTDPFSETVEAALVHTTKSEDKWSARDAILMTTERITAELEDLEADEGMTQKALRILAKGSSSAYARALAELREDTQQWWADQLAWAPDDYDEDQVPFAADAESLERFLETEILLWYRKRRRELHYGPLIRAQAFGEAVDPNRLEGLARYEVHLDRKLERTLAMLIRLQDLRGAARSDDSVSQNR
jgi:hypothetical protein